MLEFLETNLPVVSAASVGLLIGLTIAWLIMSARRAAVMERLRASDRRVTELEARVAQAAIDLERHEQASRGWRDQLAETRGRLEAERQAAADRQQWLERGEARMADAFKALSADALRISNEQFLQLAHASLDSRQEQARQEWQQSRESIRALVAPVAESLEKFDRRVGEIETLREGAYAALREQVRALGEGQLGLRRETAALVKSLRQPTGRGQWGEMHLRRVVELAGMLEHCDFHTQVETAGRDERRLRPDLVVRLPGGRSLVVDAKTPMDAYLDALEAVDDEAREAALARHARQLRGHIQQLAAKQYHASFERAPEFTVLFLPGESLFAAALQADPSLIEAGAEQGVLLATPTTLIALLRAVACGWREESITAHAREIAALGRSLHERLLGLTGHFVQLGRSLGQSVAHFNRTVGALEARVMPAARRFEEWQGVPPKQHLPGLAPLEVHPREPLAAAESATPTPQVQVADLTGNARLAAADLRAALLEEEPP